MAIVQISKIQHRSGNLVDLPQLDEAEFGWASDQKRLFIGKTTPNENVEVLTAYSQITFSQIDGSVGNLNISNVTVADGQVLAFDGNNWVNRGGIAGGLITLGDVSNVKLGGGAVGYILQTDGTGNLSWTPKGTLVSPILDVSKASTAVVTTDGDNFFTTGSQITIVDAQGMTQLNGNIFFANVLTSTTFELYSDSALTTPVDSTGYTAYANTTVTATTVSTNIITVGDSTSFSVGSPVKFIGNMSTSGISNTETYFVLSTPNATSLKIATSNDANTSNVVPLQTTSGLTASVYQEGGLAVSSLNAGISFSAAAGANTMVQYNDTGSMQGSASFTYNDTTKLLTVGGNANVNNLNSTGGVFASRFVSNVANGTTPIQVVSTDRVPNLNVSYANVSDYGVVTTQNSGIYYPIVVNANTSANYALASNANFSFDLTNSLFTTNKLSVTGNANVGNIGAAAGVFTGNISAGNATVTGQLISTVADGTAPLVVTSTTTVANLTASVAEVSINANVTGETTGVFYPTLVNDSISGEYSLGANANIAFDIDTGTLTVDNVIVLDDTLANNSNVTTDLNVGNDLVVVGNTTSAYFIGDGSQLTNLPIATVLANGTSNVRIPTVNGNVNTSVGGVANVLVVTSSGSNVTGNLGVTGNIFSGNVSVTSNVTGDNVVATGNLYTSNNIEVTKDARITGNANVTANVNLLGNLNSSADIISVNSVVNGNLSANNLATGYFANVGGNLNVGGNASIGGNTAISGTVTIIGNTAANNLTLTNTANIGANINVTGNSKVTGNSNVTGNLGVNGSTSINSSLTVAGNVTFTGLNISLGTVDKVKVFGGSSGFLLTTDGSGNLSFANPNTLSAQPAGSNSQIQFNDNGVLFANSGFTFDRFAGNLNVPGNAIVSQTITGTRLNVTANSSIGTDLVVGGNANVGSNVAVNGRLTVSGISQFNSNVVISSNLNVSGQIIGNGSSLTSITGANVTGKVANAVYADNAGTAANATYASSAASANNATTAVNATNAVNATYANSAGQATNATNAINATNAGYATSAGSATTASVAGTVTNPTQANITSVGTLGSLTVSGALSAGSITSSGNTNFSSGTQFTRDVVESVSISGTALTSVVNVNLLGPAITYYSSAPSGTWIFNFRGNGSVPVSSYLTTGKAVTSTSLVLQGPTPYAISSVRIDGTPVTVKWLGGTAPTTGNANSIDAYTFTILMTGPGSYIVFGSLTKYA